MFRNENVNATPASATPASKGVASSTLGWFVVWCLIDGRLARERLTDAAMAPATPTHTTVTERQPNAGTMTPVASGTTIATVGATTAKRPNARARSSASGKVLLRTDRPTIVNAIVPTAPIASATSNTDTVGASPTPSAPRANNEHASSMTRRSPSLSANVPVTNTAHSAAPAEIWATTMVSSAVIANCFWISSSMNSRLEKLISPAATARNAVTNLSRVGGASASAKHSGLTASGLTASGLNSAGTDTAAEPRDCVPQGWD